MSARIPTIVNSYSVKQDEIVQLHFNEWRKLNTDLQRRATHRDKLNNHALNHSFPSDLNIKFASLKLPDSFSPAEKEEHNVQEKDIWDTARKSILALRIKRFSDHVAALRIESDKLRDPTWLLTSVRRKTLPPGTDPNKLVEGIRYLITAHEESLELKRTERENAAAAIIEDPPSEEVSNSDLRKMIQQLAQKVNSIQLSQGNSPRPATKAKVGGTGFQKSSTNGGRSTHSDQQKKKQPKITSKKEETSLSKRGNILEHEGGGKRGKGK